MKEKLILLGAGGHAKVIIDILLNTKKYNIVGTLTKDKVISDVLGVPIIGGDEKLEDLFNSGVKNSFIAIGATGNNCAREDLFNKVKSIGYNLINIIHPSSIVGLNVNLGFGNVLMAGSIINPSTTLGDNVIINTGSIVEHDVLIGSHVHVAPGAKIAGGVIIGDNSHVGIGACINQGIVVGKNVIIGAGAVVINDLPDNCTVVGVPARIIRKL